MTGYVVVLGFAAGVSECSIARSLTALAAFLAGAVLGGRLGSRMAEPGRLRWLRTAAACEAALLVVAGLASIGFNLASAPLTLHLHALIRSEEHTSELQSQSNLVCRLLLEKK